MNERVYYGEDIAAAWTGSEDFTYTQDVLQRLDASCAARALERLSETLAAHDRGPGVWVDSRAWIVTASRR